MSTISANQRLVNEAYAHIKATGKASLDRNGDCSYAGSGCAFSPAIKPKYRENGNIVARGASYVIRNYPEFLENWARRLNPILAQAVQNCHDVPALREIDEGESFTFEEFARRLERVCKDHSLHFPGDKDEG